MKNDESKIDVLIEFLAKLCDKIVKIAGDEFERKKNLLESFLSNEIIEKIFSVFFFSFFNSNLISRFLPFLLKRKSKKTYQNHVQY